MRWRMVTAWTYSSSVIPRAVRRREVDVEPGTLGQPGADERGLVGAVVVHDDMDVDGSGHVRINPIEELAKLGGPVSAITVVEVTPFQITVARAFSVLVVPL